MPARRKKATEPCPECFPDGWEGIEKKHDGVNVSGVGCEHGTWSRDGKTSDPKTSDDGSGDGSGDGPGEGDGDGQGLSDGE